MSTVTNDISSHVIDNGTVATEEQPENKSSDSMTINEAIQATDHQKQRADHDSEEMNPHATETIETLDSVSATTSNKAADDDKQSDVGSDFEFIENDEVKEASKSMEQVEKAGSGT